MEYDDILMKKNKCCGMKMDDTLVTICHKSL